jgi:hypothetical protein
VSYLILREKERERERETETMFRRKGRKGENEKRRFKKM